MTKEKKALFDYDEDSIQSLDWKEHIRLRPGMYIGKLGDGASHVPHSLLKFIFRHP